MNKTKALKLVISIAVCQIAGIIGSIFTAPAINTWYASLAKPEIVPPNWIFAPAWTILFLLMGISLYIVWNKGINKKQTTAFSIQLELNIAWSAIFFGLKNPLLALIEIILLWIAILATIILFKKTSKTAAILLLPYIAWTSYAMLLNYQIWMLNT